MNALSLTIAQYSKLDCQTAYKMMSRPSGLAGQLDCKKPGLPYWDKHTTGLPEGLSIKLFNFGQNQLNVKRIYTSKKNAFMLQNKIF